MQVYLDCFPCFLRQTPDAVRQPYDRKLNLFRERSLIMPGGDRTGPVGMGPMTGRGAGFCAGYSTAGYTSPVGGRGLCGRGGGGGRGRRNWFRATGLPFWARMAQGFFGAPSAEQEREALRQQSQHLQESLDAINRRLEDLEKQKT
jgi:hypothetical protein